MSSAPRIDRLQVATPQGVSGVLATTPAGYLFGYAPDAVKPAEISLTMPLRLEHYRTATLLPIFQMNLPEGYLLERLRQRLAKATPLDPMMLLAITGGATAIGRVKVQAPAEWLAGLGMDDSGRSGENLEQILAWDGAENLFDELARRYLLRSGISGVQPKLLVPEAPAAGKASMVTNDLIVKSGGDDFPGLAVNEFVCMSAVRAAGVAVPDFHLSANRQLFVMRRFDRDADGANLGFEEMAVLMGTDAAQKYDGSYERIARFIGLFCSPAQQPEALAQLFDQVVLSCILGNGDAHLKNFGVVYSDPTADDDVRMAPAYDLVNTTAYIPDDSLALTLAGSKSFFRARVQLFDFGRRHCRIREPQQRVDTLVAIVEQTLLEHHDLLSTEPIVARGLHRAFENFSARRSK